MTRFFLTDTYSIEYHLKSFEKIAQELSGQVSFCVISFLDLYEKTKRNFPEAKRGWKIGPGVSDARICQNRKAVWNPDPYLL